MLLFSDINPYHASCEWKNVDGQKREWLPCMGRPNKLKRWWRELSQENMEITCGIEKANRD